MNFASDNHYGASAEILRALSRIGQDPDAAYGDDAITARVRARLCDVFEREVAVYPVINGTTANALSLATLVPPHGAIFCHDEAHIAVDECGAPEFFTHGAKLALVAGDDAKLTPAGIEQSLKHFQKGFVHHNQPAAVSLTQSTELGTVYAPAELQAIAALARKHGMKVHMDGARFANALVSVGCTPAELTWKSGVDVLSFGATKNGALAAEAVIFFDPRRGARFRIPAQEVGALAVQDALRLGAARSLSRQGSRTPAGQPAGAEIAQGTDPGRERRDRPSGIGQCGCSRECPIRWQRSCAAPAPGSMIGGVPSDGGGRWRG
ncbi:MAG: beta-eliminating lyase-related protein [Rhizomicrobium sp.]